MRSYNYLSHIEEYIKQRSHLTLEDFELQFRNTIGRIKKFKPIDEETKILEVGTGIGWFPILCKKHGIYCCGLEICPQLVEYGKRFGKKYGIEPNIEIGNIEETDIGVSKYDIAIALSTFEHVEHWQIGIRKIFDALKPKGLFLFFSTNRFSFFSGEFNFPLYGWFPDKWRYRIRTSRNGEDIMKMGIDFNQFNHFQLKGFFLEVGFSRVLDQFEVIDSENLIEQTLWKRTILKMIKVVKPLKLMGLTFSSGTLFVCIK